jgi:hypothetical protein
VREEKVERPENKNKKVFAISYQSYQIVPEVEQTTSA